MANLSKLVCLLALVLSANASAIPARVLIIRHGEKPDQGDGLSPKGFARANALPAFFASNPIATQYGPPAGIFAAAPKATDGSVRSIQTIMPTAQAFHVNLDTRFTKDDVQQVAYQVLNNPAFQGRMVIICWTHETIPALAAALGVLPMPPPWKDEVFDRVWQLDYQPTGRILGFRDFPQHLLPGDSFR